MNQSKLQNWGQEVRVSDRMVDVHIARLRKKIERFGFQIKNRSGNGYTFVSNQQEKPHV